MINRKLDLIWMRLFFCAVNLLIVYEFATRFHTALLDFTANDEEFTKISHEDGPGCRNLTLVADHLLKTKNENGLLILRNLAYATTVFASILLIGLSNMALLVLYGAFLVALLTMNLYHPFLHHFSTRAYFITTTVLHLTFTFFYAYLPKEKLTKDPGYVKQKSTNNGYAMKHMRSRNPPELPPRPIEMMDHSFFA